jgi:hypothetical protein
VAFEQRQGVLVEHLEAAGAVDAHAEQLAPARHPQAQADFALPAAHRGDAGYSCSRAKRSVSWRR